MRVLKLRPLCDACERAEAVVWSMRARRVFCTRCSARAGGSPDDYVPLRDSAVVSALCARCQSAPAARLVAQGVVCNLCGDPSAPPFSGSHLARGVELDRMDFSRCAPRTSGKRKHSVELHWVSPMRFPSHQDLSYFQTKVPSLVGREQRTATTTTS